MKIYLVGGAVRDKLLGIPVKERDWVVVGATVAEMLQQGFRQVGKDFPVFLHPKTKEEYALARVERKTRPGYTGFEFDASPSVSLEEDLQRRDLTINAIAETSAGELVDPYHGQKDLTEKKLRHVSAAFVEDPVRILRVARFAARFSKLGFTVALETNQLMSEMVRSGEIDALVAERVWKELERALGEDHPEQFFHVLDACGALSKLFAPLALDLAALTRAASLTADTSVRFAALLRQNSLEQLSVFFERYRVPGDYRELAVLVSKYRAAYQHAPELKADELVQLLLNVDAFRRPDRFKKYLLACKACSTKSYSDLLLKCLQAAASVDAKKIALELQGKEIADRIFQERVKKISALRQA